PRRRATSRGRGSRSRTCARSALRQPRTLSSELRHDVLRERPKGRPVVWARAQCDVQLLRARVAVRGDRRRRLGCRAAQEAGTRLVRAPLLLESLLATPRTGIVRPVVETN